MPTLVSARKIDDLTVELTTKEPDSFLPINLTNLFMASPGALAEDVRRGRQGRRCQGRARKQAWAAFARDASGTGPFKMASSRRASGSNCVKNEDYWDKRACRRSTGCVLLPMPEANARTAALLSGQVDWIEAPAPDAVPQIKQRGFVIDSQRAAARLALAVLAASRARPGSTCACARPPTSASTATG